MVGMTAGPLIGGILPDSFWRGSVFLLGVPVMVVVLIAASLVLPEYRNQAGGRLDLPSIVLSLAAVLPVIYGLKETAKNGWQPVPLMSAAVGLSLGWVFVRRQRRLADPYFQVVAGLSPLRAGLWLVPQNVAMVIGSALAPQIARRVRREYVITAGLALSAIGFVLITQVNAIGGLGLPVTGLVFASGGVSLPNSRAGLVGGCRDAWNGGFPLSRDEPACGRRMRAVP